MKWLFFSLYAAVIFFTDSANAQSPATPKTYAIVIGISQYEDVSIPQLQFADKDARLFAEYLQSKPGGKVPVSQIRLLINEQATIAGISNAFDWLREACKQDDIAYVFFSGHGDVETKTIDSLGYLLAYNTPPNNYRNNAIRIADINSDANTLSVLKKSKVILITDACHSGKLAGDAYQGRQLAAKQLRLINDNEVRLASCAPDEFSAEGPQWGGGRGVFSYYLINGLQGMADNAKDGKIDLKEIENYLDSCFANDKNLLQENHKQQPIVKGNPDFLLATVDDKIVLAARSPATKKMATDLEGFKPAALTPVDSLFICLADVPIEGIINFESLNGLSAAEVPENFLKACINKYNLIDSFYQTALQQKGGDMKLPFINTLQKLSEAVKRKSIAVLFNKYLSGFIHTKAQKMINDYLKGDANEMDRREYYYTGNEKYSDFLSMHKLGFSLLSTDNRLYREMEMQQAYLSGLIARLQINNDVNRDSLLKIAFLFQYKALALDEGAAYIHNELGILFLDKNQLDSADYHLRFATDMAPTWALPWSNLIVLNLTAGNLKMAAAADSMAKKLQPENDVILVNEAILMERLNNLLAADALYRKAIGLNNSHFLAYAKLGFLTIKTGNYALADSFLYEAGNRLSRLGVATLAEAMPLITQRSENGKPMSLGPNVVGYEYGKTMSTGPRENNDSRKEKVATNKIPAKYSLLFQGLQKIKANNFAEAEKLLQKAIEISGGAIPLANHYLGVSFLKQSKWKEAEASLKIAISNFHLQESLRKKIDAAFENCSPADSARIISTLIILSKYDIAEDYFLLAKQYEKRGLKEEALKTYSAAAAVQRFTGWFVLAYIKSARLLEEMGDFLQEEKLLLDIFDLMKKSVNTEVIVSRDFADIKTELYNFYEIRIKQFPNQPEWYKKAGWFLFQQLEPVFKNAGTQDYNDLYNGFSANKYPLLQRMECADTMVFKIPGTGDTMEMIYPDVNPVTKSLSYLQKTLQLWGVAEKPFDAVFAVAQLNSWIGNRKEAIKWFEEVLDMQPKNSNARNTYIQYLTFINEQPIACEQLQVLYDNRQAVPNQQLLLANYRLLSGQYKKSEEMLKKCAAANEVEKGQLMQLYATLWYLSGNPKKALQYLSDSLKEETVMAGDGHEIRLAKEEKNCFRLYSIARYTALAGDVKKGFVLLKNAFDKGFKKYKYVLENDNAWTSLMGTKEWKVLIARAHPINYYYFKTTTENHTDFLQLISQYWH